MARPIKISATRIQSFLKCKKKYWFQYVKHLPKMGNPAFRLGIACHESLEVAGRLWMEHGHLTDDDKKAVLAFYNEISIREGIEEMEAHHLGVELVTNRINNFDIGEKIVSLEETFGFFKSKFPDLETDLGVPLIGAMDKVVELDEDSLLIIDYKTSKTAPTPDQLKTDLQLSLYDLVANILYPNYKRIILCLDMLKSDPVYSYRTPEQRDEFGKYIKEIHTAMVNFKEKEAKPSLHMLCPWCDFKDYCDEYLKAISNTEYEFLPIMNLSNEKLIEEWDRIKTVTKLLDMRKKELNMVIMEKIKDSGTDLIVGDTKVIVRQNARTNYDTKLLKEVVNYEDYVGMSSVSKKAVDTYCSKNPAKKKDIEKAAIVNFTAPFLMAKDMATKKKKSKKKT